MSEILDELIEYKNDIEKDYNVIKLFLMILYYYEEKIIKILKLLNEMKVTSKDIRVIIYIIINFKNQGSKISITFKQLKKSKNPTLRKELKNIYEKWKKISEEPDKKQNTINQKPKTLQKKNQDDFPENKLTEVPRRNSTRKNLFKNLKSSIYVSDEKQKEELIKKVVDIEEKINEKYKGDSPYTNRVLEIMHNIKENEEFKNKIVKGEIKSDDLCTMDVIDMLNKVKRKEIDKEIEEKTNSMRSDWEKKHAKVSSGIYKCKKCGGNQTTQSEMQTRSADEPMTLFIRCLNCDYQWKLSQIFSL